MIEWHPGAGHFHRLLALSVGPGWNAFAASCLPLGSLNFSSGILTNLPQIQPELPGSCNPPSPGLPKGSQHVYREVNVEGPKILTADTTPGLFSVRFGS